MKFSWLFKCAILLLAMSSNVSSFYLTLLEKEKASQNDTYSFYFSRPDMFTFLPGQYLKMTLDIKENMLDDRGNSRYFTIASSPTEKDSLMITTRIMKSAFKTALSKLTVGDKVLCSGPYGNFVLNEKDKRARVFLAGGIGITPARSMSAYIQDTQLEIPFTIIASFSLPDDVVYYDELKQLEKTLKHFRYIVTVTRPEESHISWTGETRRISDTFIKKHIEKPFDSYYYIVGPTLMVTSLYDLVKQMGVAPGNIKTENFPGY